MNSLSFNDFFEMPLDELIHAASFVRHEHFNNEIEFCAIINAKNGRCTMDCRFCAQSIHYVTQVKDHELCPQRLATNESGSSQGAEAPIETQPHWDARIESYPLLERGKLVQETQSQWKRGIHRIGWVTSGCSANNDELSQIVEAASQCQGERLCVSLGQLDEESLKRLKKAGITRYHHNLETSEKFYPTVCSTQRWRDRYDTVCRAKRIGFEICCGGLFGLGESWQDRYDLALTLRELAVDSVPINFLSPISGTPLADQSKLSTEEGLRIIAMFRLLLPKTTIRICGGRPSTFGNRQSEVLDAGANAIMTGDYLTTNGISPESDLYMIEQHGFRTKS